MSKPAIEELPQSAHSNDVEKHSTPEEHAPQMIQDWDGSTDPENPMNWPSWKKAYHTMASASLGFAVTCGSSLITPSATKIQQDFNVSLTAAILTLSLFSLGLGVGPVIAAPISETW